MGVDTESEAISWKALDAVYYEFLKAASPNGDTNIFDIIFEGHRGDAVRSSLLAHVDSVCCDLLIEVSFPVSTLPLVGALAWR